MQVSQIADQAIFSQIYYKQT